MKGGGTREGEGGGNNNEGKGMKGGGTRYLKELPGYDPKRPYVYLEDPGEEMVTQEVFERMEKHLLREREAMEEYRAALRSKLEGKRDQIYLLYAENQRILNELQEDFKREATEFSQASGNPAHAEMKIKALSKKERMLRLKHMQSLNIFAKQLHNFKDYSKREMRHAKAKFWPMANKGRLECGMKGLDDDEGFVEVDVDIGERMGEGGRGETSRKAEAQVQQQVKATTTKGGLEGEDATKISPAQSKKAAPVRTRTPTPTTQLLPIPQPPPMYMLHCAAPSAAPSAPLIIDRVTKVKSSHPSTVLVEIHNEGVYWRGVSVAQEKGKKEADREEMRRRYNKFIHWGQKARRFLFMILCGDVPDDPVGEEGGRGRWEGRGLHR
jgi:hypothetical protein